MEVEHCDIIIEMLKTVKMILLHNVVVCSMSGQ